MMITKSGDRLTILDGPPQLTQELGIGLRANFPRKITTDRATEDGLHVYEVRRGGHGGTLPRALLSFSVVAAHPSDNLISQSRWTKASWSPIFSSFSRTSASSSAGAYPWAPGASSTLASEKNSGSSSSRRGTVRRSLGGGRQAA